MLSADGLYFSTDVPVVFINKAKGKPLRLGDFEAYFGDLPSYLYEANDQACIDHMCNILKSNNPNMTQWEKTDVVSLFARGPRGSTTERR